MRFHSSCRFLWDWLACAQISSARRRPFVFIVFPLHWGRYCDNRGSLISFSWLKQAVNMSANKDWRLLLLPLNKVLLHFHPHLTVLVILRSDKKPTGSVKISTLRWNSRCLSWCKCSFDLCLHSFVGNSDSGKWTPWFEGETSACGRRARIWGGSERDQRLHTGENWSF